MGSGRKKTKSKSKTPNAEAAGSKLVKVPAAGGRDSKAGESRDGKDAKPESSRGGRDSKSESSRGGKDAKPESSRGSKAIRAAAAGSSKGTKVTASGNKLAKITAIDDRSVKKAAAGNQGNGRAGKASMGKKGGGKAKHRNPNLKLVKSDDIPVKKASPKSTALRKTPPKDSLKGTALSGTASGNAVFKKVSPKKASWKAGWKETAYESKPIAYDRPGPGEWLAQHKSLVIIWLIVFAVIAALASAYYYAVTNYKVTTVYVDGNIHYSNEEIMDMVMDGVYGDNSLYLAIKYKDKGVIGVPFVEKMDVNILAPDTIRISVYEKALAGYVEYLGRFMYFDRNGIVVESSLERTAGIPQVTGLQFGYVVLNEALPVENDAIFKRILSITQLLEKYELMADKIYFNSDYELTLYFEGVRVTLGASEEIDEKIMRLQYILPELAGKSGTLSMEKYTEDTKLIPFHQD